MSTERIDIAAVLKASALFGAAAEGDLAVLAARMSRKHFAAGELLFSEGEPCKGLYTILRGRARIFKTSVHGREQVLSVEGAGGTVAELPVFDGGPYPASVVAVEPVEIAFISRGDFQRFCIEHPEVALQVLAVVGERLRQLVGIIEELSFTTIRQRLASVLVKLAQSEGTKTAAGIAFRLPSSHQEMASQLGTVRELISRNLTRLQSEGLLEVNARDVLVKDLPGLTALLEQG